MQFSLGSTVLAASLGTLICGSAIASPTTLDLYHLGESDPGAMAGNTGNATTIDSVGAKNLSLFGTPTYSSNVAAPGSTISMTFNGTTDYYQYSTVVSTATTDIAIDAWVYPTLEDTTASIAYNGNSGASGYGIYQYGSAQKFTPVAGKAIVGGLAGGNTLGPTAYIPLNAWTEVTVVISGGLDSLYINGGASPVDSVPLVTGMAYTPTSNFHIGGHGSEFFAGNVDEVRVYSTVPEPASLGLIALGSVGVLSRRRRA